MPPSRAKTESKKAKEMVDLSLEINALRLTLNELCERYRIKVDAALVELLATIRGGREGQPLTASVISEMLAVVRKVELKPRKARSKDFERLEKVVDDLEKLLSAHGN